MVPMDDFSQLNLDVILNAIVDAVWVYDTEGHVLYMNNAAQELVGIKDQASYISLDVEQRLGGYQLRDASGNPLPKEQWGITRLLKGEVLAGEQQMESIIHTNDGREVFIKVSGSPLRDASGAIRGAVVVVRDVTKQNELERRTQQVLTSLLEIAEEIVQVPEQKHDPPPETDQPVSATRNAIEQRLAQLVGHILGFQIAGFVSIEQETGKLHPLAVIGLSPLHEQMWWEEIHRSSLDDYLTPVEVAHLLANEVVVRDLVQAPFNDRSDYGVQRILFAPMLNNGQLIGVLGMVANVQDHDYTQQERAFAKAVARLAVLVIERERLLEERAEALSKAQAWQKATERMNTFLGIASHELRTPITALQGFSELLEMWIDRGKSLDTPQTFHAIHQIIQQSQRLTRLIEDMLDLSRLENGRLSLQLEPHDLLETLKETVETQSIIYREHRLKLVVEGLQSEGTLPGWFDRQRIEQVLENLIQNAAKYSPPGSEIEVGMHYDAVKPCEVLLWVKDQGVGIAESEVPRIFDRFYRSDNLDRSISGFGIGLYLVHEFVIRHGGYIRVETTEGRGSIFYVSLPLHTEMTLARS